jgi:hypothetical protein
VARMPGAIWEPKNIGDRARRNKGRGVVFHVAVSNSDDLHPGPDADWHFYVNRRGQIFQYIDTDYQCWAQSQGNKSLVGVETEGGLDDPDTPQVETADTEPWSEAALDANARIARWLHENEGAPLKLMQDSRLSSTGIGWHRLGIDPWRVSGGESWSASRGKRCPGDAKINQMPEILRRALGNPVEDDLPNPDDLFNAPLFTDNPGTPEARTVRLRDVLNEIREAANRPVIDPDVITAAVAAGVKAGIESVTVTLKEDQ